LLTEKPVSLLREPSNQLQNLHDNPARTRRMSALAQIEESRMKQINGELYRAVDIESAVTWIFSSVPQRMLANPSRVSWQLVGVKDFREIHTVINNEIRSGLSELSVRSYREKSKAWRKARDIEKDGDDNGSGAVREDDS